MAALITVSQTTYAGGNNEKVEDMCINLKYKMDLNIKTKLTNEDIGKNLENVF